MSVRTIPPASLGLVRAIDALHLEYPFAGSRMWPRGMSIEALYPRLKTLKLAPVHKIFSGLLRKLP